ncbi:MAG: hypothetical protein M1530_04400 [Candidatus Marsarchaeota archaeon]|nr:hypothetical protein [Candidatus Marsarchaeota archaeon]
MKKMLSGNASRFWPMTEKAGPGASLPKAVRALDATKRVWNGLVRESNFVLPMPATDNLETAARIQKHGHLQAVRALVSSRLDSKAADILTELIGYTKTTEEGPDWGGYVDERTVKGPIPMEEVQRRLKLVVDFFRQAEPMAIAHAKKLKKQHIDIFSPPVDTQIHHSVVKAVVWLCIYRTITLRNALDETKPYIGLSRPAGRWESSDQDQVREAIILSSLQYYSKEWAAGRAHFKELHADEFVSKPSA